MKKFALAFAGLMIAGTASAVEFEATGTLRIADCALLNEDVRINLSNSVEAGVDCNGRAIALSACHIAGRTTQRSVPVCVDTDGNADTGIGGLEDCTSQPPAVTSGPAIASATTLEGTVISQYPGGEAGATLACDATAAEAQATANLPAEN